MTYHYSIGPWQWRDTPDTTPGWYPPAGTIGVIDLRTEAQCGTPETQDGAALFVTTARLGSDYAHLGTGDLRELSSTARMRSRIASLTGQQPEGRTLLECLRYCLLDGGDPEGQARWKPLMPTQEGHLDVHLGGHGLVHREAFTWGQHPHTACVQAVHLHDLARLHPHLPLEQTQRVLGGLLRQYGLQTEHWRTFVPRHLHQDIPGPLPPATTIADNFNRADNASLGTSSDAQFSWTQTNGLNGGSTRITSNTCSATLDYGQSTDGVARADFDFASANHYAQANIGYGAGTAAGGLLCRYSSTVQTYYRYVVSQGATYTVGKVITGTFTSLGSASDSEVTLLLAKLTASGSSLVAVYNGSTKVSLTDTAISGNLRTGVFVAQIAGVGSQQVDNFGAGDVPGVAVLTAQLVWVVSGVSGMKNVVCLKSTIVSAEWIVSGGSAHTYSFIFSDVTNESGFVSTATTSLVTRTFQYAGGTQGIRRVSSTVSALTSGVGSTLTSAILVHVGGVTTPSLWDNVVQKESQKYRRTWPL